MRTTTLRLLSTTFVIVMLTMSPMWSASAAADDCTVDVQANPDVCVVVDESFDPYTGTYFIDVDAHISWTWCPNLCIDMVDSRSGASLLLWPIYVPEAGTSAYGACLFWYVEGERQPSVCVPY